VASVPQTVSVPAAELRGVVGTYHGDLPAQVYEIRMEGDSLRLGNPPGQLLRPLGSGRFAVGTAVITYHPASGATAAWLEVPGGARAPRMPGWDPSEEELRTYEGTWMSDELGTEYRLVLEDGGLVVHHRKLEPSRMRPVAAPRIFMIGGAEARFQEDGSGVPSSFTLSDGRVWNVRFRRVADGT
jgi:hypothetical protein